MIHHYYTRDHLGSVREMTDSSGTILTRYTYDPYGRTTTNHLSGSTDATFQYAGYYAHQPSGLLLTRNVPGVPGREYDATNGRLNANRAKNKGRASFLKSRGALIATCSASIRTSQHTGHPHPVFVPANHRNPSDSLPRRQTARGLPYRCHPPQRVRDATYAEYVEST